MTTATLEQAIATVEVATAGHQPGTGYFLGRGQFLRFLEELDDQSIAPPDWEEEYFDQRAALWRHIGAREASRVFTDMGSCPSVLSITQKVMEWEYLTTSGTALLALDNREARGSIYVREEDLYDLLQWEDLPDYCLPWDHSQNTLRVPQEGLYRVWIPEERDQPGRTAWTQVRLALSGLPYRCWYQEGDSSDEAGTLRRQLREYFYSLRE